MRRGSGLVLLSALVAAVLGVVENLATSTVSVAPNLKPWIWLAMGLLILVSLIFAVASIGAKDGPRSDVPLSSGHRWSHRLGILTAWAISTLALGIVAALVASLLHVVPGAGSSSHFATSLATTLESIIRPSAVAFGPDGQTIVVGSGETVTAWDIAGSRRIGDPWTLNVAVDSLALNSDGKTVAVGSRGTFADPEQEQHYNNDGGVWVGSTNFPREMMVRITKEVTNDVTFSPDGRFLVIAELHGLELWNVASNRLEAKLPVSPHHYAAHVAFSADGKLAIGESSFDQVESVVTLWDPAQWKQLGQIPVGGSQFSNSLAFNVNDHMLVTNDLATNTVRLWDSQSGRQLGTIIDPDAANIVTCLDLSPDGKMLAIASRTVRLWDASNRQEIAHLDTSGEESDGYTVCKFSPDGRKLAVGTIGLQIWNVTR